MQEINNLCYSMLSSCGVSISVCETVWKQILLPHFWVASTALVIPMNKGIQGVGGSVEAEMMKTLMKKQQLSWLFG